MPIRKIIFLISALLLILTLNITVFRHNLDSDIRIFNDYSDTSVYAKDGSWFVSGQTPYRDIISEYPQIPTYLFAVPYFFGLSGVGPHFSKFRYHAIFSFMMMCVLAGGIILLYAMLPTHKNRAFLMLLPASLYFTFNRFDILPAILVLVSLFFIQKNQTVLAAITLAVGTMTKWYPALLLPVCLAYIFRTQKRIDWKFILAFGLTCLIIITPTLITGGIKALLVPYALHAARGSEQIAITAIIGRAYQHWFRNELNPSAINYLFMILSILPVPFSFFARVNSVEKLTHWFILIIGSFVVFSRIWSPQWLLWLLPLLILSARNLVEHLAILLYGILNYVAFPWMYDYYDHRSKLLAGAGMMGFLLIFFFAFFAIRRLTTSDSGNAVTVTE